ncbi:hypothetical protein C4J93_3553 [Pseudomonas sp. R2-37-08W]|uniref:hypothetical protein n=1 Tax=Pseudomonas sp. R2-37-08W TaxID=1173273 RepID=UPI000F56E439|nr:hypothetical protein [Pseudomonas sp. R2-37-08W]AZF11735.1 hypothetical protein C4J93_3553 [Pseudomonas sp. R2-37-08W]
MTLSISAATIAPANIRLAPSEQKLTPQALPEAAKQSLANAGPAAVYHPSEAAQTASEPPQVTDVWVGRSESPEFPRFVDRFHSAQAVLKSAFTAFASTLKSTAPDLARTDYGFTVEADGRLKVIDKAGQLSDANIKRLTELLNGSADLKTAAVTFRNAAIDMTDAGSPWSGSGMGYYSLTNENFAKTIDLAPLFRTYDPSDVKGGRERFFIIQLTYKGERATAETERAMYARRAGQAY